MQAQLGMAGKLAMRVTRAPKVSVIYKVRNLPRIWLGLLWHMLANFLGMNHFLGTLRARVTRADGSVLNYGLVSVHLVTTAFVNFVVAQLQTESSEFGDFKYHDSGVGITPANVSDIDIETTDGELRVIGTQIEGASPNVYKSVATISYTTLKAITEHGLFSQATGTTLMDRHTFSEINVDNGDSITFTYELTCSAGG